MNNALESLKYKRGSLEVLDQLLLPGKTIYIPVKGSKDAWNVIRTMQVRGAPLIAIVAALGLAVEAHGKDFGDNNSPQAAGKFLLDEMQYLRTSRPTAVNLFTATDQLASVVNAALANPATYAAADVIKAYVEAAEDIWKQDLLTNRAIGDHGARRILDIMGISAESKRKVRVLTICNTGSLATAGYGTALGVVRSLHALDRLEHVYACETRPYNQGARLTAYEIVAEQLPGTLIADSMASALMKTKGVDCVVVGADRVAANGDTANKVGTYQLAIAAQYHKIPFFAAVPTTSIDLSMHSGAEIRVEERPDHELTHIFGQRLAAEGINVWNPAFDVTPCSLIRGIITEAGVAEADATIPDNTDRVIDLPSFIKASCAASGGLDLGLTMRLTTAVTVRTNAPSAFQVMSEERIAAYLAKLPTEILQNLDLGISNSADATALTIREVGDGNLNFVYLVTGPSGKCVVVKQALPYIRVVQSWPLTLQRASFETRALQEQHRLCPEYVPEVFHFDASLALILMRFVAPPHLILRKAFIQGLRFSTFADHLSSFLARTLYGTSALALGGSAFRQKVSQWSLNVQLCALTEKVVFTDPYSLCDANRWTSPQLDSFASWFRENAVLKVSAAAMKAKFVTSTQCLVHGDLHSGSVMACEGSTFVIDPEFAFYGPMGFDLGAIMANILLAYFAQAARPGRDSYADWLLEQLVSMMERFATKFTDLWRQDACSGHRDNTSGELYRSQVFNDIAPSNIPTAATVLAQESFMAQLWTDAVGFAAMKMIRRVLGISHVEDLESIDDKDQRASCEKRVLMLAQEMLVTSAAAATYKLNNHTTCFTNVRALAATARSFYAANFDAPH